MYEGDSFFTLSVLGQVGLACLSLVLGGLSLLAVWGVSRGKPVAVRWVIAIVAFFLFVWLSPQVYYTYYLFLFDVPVQSVIKFPPGPVKLARFLAFADRTTLSAHSTGLLGWAMLITAALRPWLTFRR